MSCYGYAFCITSLCEEHPLVNGGSCVVFFYYRERIMYLLEWRTASALIRGLFWCLFPELRSNEGNIHQNNTRETLHHDSAYIILFLTRHNESINDDKNDDLYTSSRVSLARFSFCWWRHQNRLLMTSQWPGNCGAITWIVITNSLDIDFIHGDIHGRSCKKVMNLIFGNDCLSYAYVYVYMRIVYMSTYSRHRLHQLVGIECGCCLNLSIENMCLWCNYSFFFLYQSRMSHIYGLCTFLKIGPGNGPQFFIWLRE